MPRKPIDVLLVPGHSVKSPGAVNQGIHEAYLWRALGRWLVGQCRAEGVVTRIDYRREEDGNAEERNLALVDRIRKMGPLILVDLHDNAGGYPGSTAIARPGDDRSRHACEVLAATCAAAQGNRLLRVKDNRSTDGVPRAWNKFVVIDDIYIPTGSELYLVSERTQPTIPVILEPFDGSVPADYALGIAAWKSGKAGAAVAKALSGLVEQFRA